MSSWLSCGEKHGTERVGTRSAIGGMMFRPRNAFLLLLVYLIMQTLSGCARDPASAVGFNKGYLCCNMRSDGDWISDSNYMESGKRVIPLGTPIKVIGFGRYRVNIEIDGEYQSIGNDYSRDLTMEEFARRYIVKEDPRSTLAAAPEKIKRAIESARVTKGMTRDQVVMALGYPISSENPHLDTSYWKYWLWSFSPFEVYFGADDRVSRVTGDEDTLRKIYLP